MWKVESRSFKSASPDLASLAGRCKSRYGSPLQQTERLFPVKTGNRKIVDWS